MRPNLTALALASSAFIFHSAMAQESADDQVIELDSGDTVRLWEQMGAPHYSITRANGQIAVSRETSYDLLLRYARFDPLVAEPEVPAALEADPDSTLRIVQFVTQPLQLYRDQIEALGAEIHHSVGHHAYLISIPPEAVDLVAKTETVRWIGPYHPAYRVEPELLTMLSDVAHQPEDAHRYSIQVLRKGFIDQQLVADHIQAIGGAVEMTSPGGRRMEATLSPAQLLDILQMDEVVFADRAPPVQTYMDNVREVGGANYLESVAGYTGKGVRGEAQDTGLLLSHQAFQANPPIIHGQNSSSTGHGTSVYGIVFGDGTGSAAGRGLIPDAQGLFSSFIGLRNRRGHIAELASPTWAAVFQTNSWGSCCTNNYTTQAADMDDILFDNDFLLLQAQANTGSRNSDYFSMAKNLVTVGAVRHRDTATLTDDAWQGSGSIGPVSDGRIKPDLSFWFDSILTTSNDGTYTTGFGGTSAATPTTAGHFGLFFQMWGEGIFGNAVTPGASVYDNRPHMSTAKAMMVNTASPYPFSGTNHDLTRVHQGWGRADVARLYDRRDRMFIVDESDVLNNLETMSYTVEVAANEPELRATLVYADPAGVPSSTRHRVNDLTLRVTSPSGIAYFGNNGLAAGNASTPGGSANEIDTVENVWVTNPEAGEWIVEVMASEIVEDAHVETPEIDADFALVVSGAIEAPIANCYADCDQSTGVGVLDIFDFLCFQDDFVTGDPTGYACDCDQAGPPVCDIFDFLCFQQAYVTGCP